MKTLPLVILAAVLPFSACASSDDRTQEKIATSAPSQQGKIVEVEIVVGTKPDLDAQCLGNVSATTVFVVSQKEVYHCVGKKLLHHDEHGKTPAMDTTIVRVSATDRIRWFSKTSLFTVTSVTKQVESLGPQDKTAPDTPFGVDFTAKMGAEVLSIPVPDLPGNVQQRYKVAFNIQGVGPVDPDIVCSM